MLHFHKFETIKQSQNSNVLFFVQFRFNVSEHEFKCCQEPEA